MISRQTISDALMEQAMLRAVAFERFDQGLAVRFNPAEGCFQASAYTTFGVAAVREPASEWMPDPLEPMHPNSVVELWRRGVTYNLPLGADLEALHYWVGYVRLSLDRYALNCIQQILHMHGAGDKGHQIWWWTDAGWSPVCPYA